MSKKNGRGAQPGENRFKSMQDTRVKKTILEIDSVLRVLKSSRVKFHNVTSLASYVAAVVNERRCAVDNRLATSTLLRSSSYRLKLDSYLASLEGESFDDKFTGLLTSLEKQELEDLIIENKRLSIFIKNNLGKIPEDELPSARTENTLSHEELCRALSLVLEASKGQFVLDFQSGEIVSAWARSNKNRVIVQKNMAKYYFEWVRNIPSLK